MADDFAKTADRMMTDANLLKQAGAHRNACYLSGYVVECTLKALLASTGGPAWGHDLESLHDKVAALLVNGNALVSKYGDPSQLAPTMRQQIQPQKVKSNGVVVHYCHWDPFYRYDGARWDTKLLSDSYLQEARACHDLLVQMWLDGLVVL